MVWHFCSIYRVFQLKLSQEDKTGLVANNTDMELDPSEQSGEPILDLADLDDEFSD